MGQRCLGNLVIWLRGLEKKSACSEKVNQSVKIAGRSGPQPGSCYFGRELGIAGVTKPCIAQAERDCRTGMPSP
jgi:hypothetical protein